MSILLYDRYQMNSYLISPQLLTFFTHLGCCLNFLCLIKHAIMTKRSFLLHPKKPITIPEVAPPKKSPEVEPISDPEEPLIPEEEPDAIPEEDPFVTPPYEVPEPGEGP